MDTSLIIVIITHVTNTGMLFFVVSKKPVDLNKSFLKIFSISIVSLIVWSTCNYLADTSTTLPSALFWTKISFIPALWMGWSILVFSYIFPTPRPHKKMTIPLYTLLVLFFSAVSTSDHIVQKVTHVPGVGITSVDVGSLYIGILMLLLALIIHPTYTFIQSYKNLSGKLRAQIKYVLFGWTTFLSLAVTTNAILPLVTGDAQWSKFGPLASVVMVIAISYAIIRHQFLDIKIIIQRGLVYTILLSVITGSYLLLVFTFEYVFHKSDNSSILISALITTLIGIFGVPPLKLYFQRVTDSVFFKDTYDYATLLSQLTDILNKNIILDTLVEKSALLIKNSLRAETVFFSFNPEEKVISEHMLSLPITSNDHYIGTLYVGEKRSGDAYTTEDMSLLETFTKQAGIALEKASLYKQVDDYAKTLEEKVEERTKEISIIQKEQETMMLEISHGLQTPLTIMKGELFLLRKQGHETKRVDTIDASIDRISSFIYRFLSLSRLETAHTVPMTTIQLTTLLHQVMQFFEQEAKEKGISLSASLADSVQVEGIREELEELFSNLISNAIKYIRKDSQKIITLTLEKIDSAAIITITDTGIGIKNENLPNLFKKFYRVKEAETKGISGTGLGLVICKKIIDKHNGTLEVTSIFGEGSTFTISLPVVATS